MGEVFIIGLPKVVRVRLEKNANARGTRIASILAGLTGGRRAFQLLPHPSQAVHHFRGYYEELDAITDVNVLTLPYAPIPAELAKELTTCQELGGQCVSPQQGRDGWPTFRVRAKSDSDRRFELELHDRILDEICPSEILLPSIHFERLRERHATLLIPDDCIEHCDLVATHRYSFFRNAGDALAELLMANGNVGVLDDFFGRRGLNLAQSGGITASLTVRQNGSVVYSASSNMHLKQGDSTTPSAAVRLYFHTFQVQEAYFVAILYAGAHPNNNVDHQLEILGL